MNAVEMKCFDDTGKVLVIDGGSFSYRLMELCGIHGVPHIVSHLHYGQKRTDERLYKYDNQGLTGILVNIDKTSTGALYDYDR